MTYYVGLRVLANCHCVRHKSVTDIVRILASVTKEQLIVQAHRNFKEAHHYEDTLLNKLRNDFFDKVKNVIIK